MKVTTGLVLLASMVFAVLLGCSVDVNPPVAAAAPPVGAPQSPKFHTESAVLNLVRTNQELSQVKSNALTVRGSGKGATYTLQYSFNSGHANVLRVMKLVSDTKSSECSQVGATKTMLHTPDGARAIGLEQQSIKPQTNYALVISIGPNTCDDFQTTHTPVVWADFVNTPVDPMFANTCHGQKSGTVSFFRQINLLTAFSESTGKTFLSGDVHCGETLYGKETAGITSSSGFSEQYVNGYFKSKFDNYEFNLVSSLKQTTLRLVCIKNNIVYHDETFADCRESVKDVTPYDR